MSSPPQPSNQSTNGLPSTLAFALFCALALLLLVCAGLAAPEADKGDSGDLSACRASESDILMLVGDRAEARPAGAFPAAAALLLGAWAGSVIAKQRSSAAGRGNKQSSTVETQQTAEEKKLSHTYGAGAGGSGWPPLEMTA